MRSKWVEQRQECSHRRHRNRFRVCECVHENHHLRDRGIERERFDVLSHFLDRGVHDFLLRFIWINIFELGGQFPLARLVFSREQTPDAGEKTGHAFDATHAPRFHLLERPHEHLVAPECVRAVLGDHIIRINNVPTRLRHLLIVFAKNDSLIH